MANRPRPTPGERQNFARVFQDAIHARGLTLDRLSARLQQSGHAISLATLSYWQSGRSMPTRSSSLRALPELDRLLELPPGYLESMLPGRLDTTERSDAVLEDYDLVVKVFEEWQVPLELLYRQAMIDEQHTVHRDRAMVTSRMRTVGRSQVDGLVSIPYVFQQTNAVAAPRVRPLGGARHGRSLVDHERGLVMGEWVLDHPANAGDDFCFTHEVEWLGGEPDDQIFERLLSQQAALVTMSVEFLGDVPERAWQTFRPEYDAEMQQVREVLVFGRKTQMVAVEPVSGLHGLRWLY